MPLASSLPLTLPLTLLPMIIPLPPTGNPPNRSMDRLLYDVLARRHANSLQPVSRLPTEMVLKIFSHTEDFQLENRRKSYNCIKVLHVCHRRYWIGVKAPTLWTTVTPAGGVECMEEMLWRSRGLPLDIYSAVNMDVEKSTAGLMVKLLAELPRARTLTAVGSFEWEFIRERAPILEELALDVIQVTDKDYRDDSDLCIAFSDMFIDGFPALRTLRVRLDYDFDGFIFAPNLRSLYLEMVDNFAFTAPVLYSANVANLLLSMGQMPLLQEITMFCLLPTDFTGLGDRLQEGRVLDLPSVTSFTIIDTAAAIAHFLDLISIPVDAFLDIRCYVESASDLTLLASSLKRKFTRRLPDGRTEKRVVCGLFVDDDTGWANEIHLKGYTDPSHCSCDECSSEADGARDTQASNFKLDILWNDDQDDWDAYVEHVEDLLKTLQLSDVSVLKTVRPGNIFFPSADASTSEQDGARSACHLQYSDDSTSDEYPHEFARVREVLPNVTSLIFSICLRDMYAFQLTQPQFRYVE